MFYDLKKHERTYSMPVGTMGQISYERLIELLVKAGEISEHETVTHIHHDMAMLRYRIGRADEK